MIIDDLIKEYIDQYPKTGFPMALVFELGETETIEILKQRDGREIKWVIDNENTRDGGKYIYI